MKRWKMGRRQQIALAGFCLVCIPSIWDWFHSGLSALEIICSFIWLLGILVGILLKGRSKVLDDACWSFIFASGAVMLWLRGLDLRSKAAPSAWIPLVLSPCVLVFALVLAFYVLKAFREGRKTPIVAGSAESAESR